MRILIAEDDPTSSLVLSATIKLLGHECLAVTDGEQAWALLQTTPVSVVISDWMMPGISGIELCQRLRADPTRASTYFILLTGMQRESDVQQAGQAGADAHLGKPLDRKQLKLLLQEAAARLPDRAPSSMTASSGTL